MSLFKQYSQRILGVIAIFLIGAVSMLALAKPAQAETQLPTNFTPDECAWVYDSLITCGTLDFWYNAQQSDSSGFPVFQFRQEESGSWVWKNNAFLILGSAGDEFTASASLDPGAQGTKYTGNVTDREKRNIRAIAQDGTSKEIFGALENSKIPADGKAVGENGKDYYAFCGIKSTKGQSCFNGRGNNLYKITSDVSTKTSTSLDEGIASSERCDADMDGLLSFIFCPLFEMTQRSVTNLIGTSADGSKRGFLIELMTISPMTQAATTNLYNVWKAFRDLALGLYVLVFIVIIFGNGLGMDAYTVKRTLPRLATAAVLTMASFFIVQTLVDLSNLLGAGLPALISNITNGDANIANFSLDLGAGGSALGILLLIVFSLVALVAVLVGMAGLIFRQIAVYILVIISPLAFVAWVLPNTESLFKKWWTNIIKLCMMFPIITGMIAMSLLFQKSLDTQTASLPLKLAATLAPLMALIAIPNTFKWGGELFAAGAGFIAGRASKAIDTGKSLGKDRASSTFKDGVGARGLRAIGTKMDGDGNRVERKGFGMIPGVGGVTNRKRAIKQAKRDVAINKRLSEGLDDVSEANLGNIYSNLSEKKQKSAYGKAVQGELFKRKGKAMADYSSALRDGRYDDANNSLKKIGIVDKALSPDKIAPISHHATSIDNHGYDDGREITGSREPKDLREVSVASAAQIRTIRDRIDRQANGGGQSAPRAATTPIVAAAGGAAATAAISGHSATPAAAVPTITPIASHSATTATPPPAPSAPTGSYTAPPPPPAAGTPVYTTPTNTPPPPPSGNVPIYTSPPPPPAAGTPVYTTPTSATIPGGPTNVTNNVTVTGGGAPGTIAGATSGPVPMGNSQEVMDGLADLSDQIRNSGGGDVMSGLSREESAKLDKIVRTSNEASSSSANTQADISDLKSRTTRSDKKLREGIQDLGDENTEG